MLEDAWAARPFAFATAATPALSTDGIPYRGLKFASSAHLWRRYTQRLQRVQAVVDYFVEPRPYGITRDHPARRYRGSEHFPDNSAIRLKNLREPSDPVAAQ
jgi:hypothetical protein